MLGRQSSALSAVSVVCSEVPSFGKDAVEAAAGWPWKRNQTRSDGNPAVVLFPSNPSATGVGDHEL